MKFSKDKIISKIDKFPKDKILNIGLVICFITINIISFRVFDLLTHLLIVLFIFAPYIFIGIQSLLPKTKKIAIEINKRIIDTASVVLIVQVFIIILVYIGPNSLNYLINFIIISACISYFFFLLRVIDALVVHWKSYSWKSLIFNIFLIIYTLPLLFFALFFAPKGIATNNESVTIEKVRFINAKTGKEMNSDSIMKPHVDSIIKEHKNSQ